MLWLLFLHSFRVTEKRLRLLRLFVCSLLAVLLMRICYSRSYM
jgi:hypothetical protein